MSRVRFFVATAGMLVLALVLAACGGGGSSAGSATTTTVAPTTTTTGSTSTGSSSGVGTISSVAFTGTTLSPTVTINGSDLGTMPTPDPTYTPEGQQLCPLPPSGDQGYDYGTSLYLFDSNRNWAGGRYRPDVGELDCVGLLVSKFSATQVVFQFGSAYGQYQQKDNYLLAEGDSYQLAVNGAMLSGTVHYTSS